MKINIVIIIVILFVGCKTYRHSSITFGSSSGDKGTIDEFIVTGNGIMSVVNLFSHDTAAIKILSKEETKYLFKKLPSKNVKNLNFNQQSNRDYFIKHSKNSKLLNAYTWNSVTGVTKELKVLNDTLISHAIHLKGPDKITIDSFYKIVNSLCERININSKGEIYENKYFARQFVMIDNTIFNYGQLLIRNGTDSACLSCLNSLSIQSIALIYCDCHLIARFNHLPELNIYIPAKNDESRYKIIELDIKRE